VKTRKDISEGHSWTRLGWGEERKIDTANKKSEDNHEDEQKLRQRCAYDRAWRKRGEELHKSSPTTLRVDFLESLFLLSLQPAISQYVIGITGSGTYLVDNAHSGHEETQQNGHKSVNSAMATR
jgi:hypothetical protein